MWNLFPSGRKIIPLGNPKLLNLLARRYSKLEEKKVLETFILFWKKGIENKPRYWNPKIFYSKTIYKYLDNPFHRTE